MSDESTRQEIATEPVYAASLRLESGAIVRVTAIDDEVVVNTCDREGRPVAGRMTRPEAMDIADMYLAAARQIR